MRKLLTAATVAATALLASANAQAADTIALVVSTRGFDAASDNYGVVPRRAERALRGACPIVASYGATDASLRGAAGTLEAALVRRGIPHDVKEYPNSGHSFMNRINVGPALGPLVKFVGLNYVHEDAEDSWRRILDFFDAHIGGASA